MAISTSDLVDQVAEGQSITKAQAKALVDGVLKAIAESVSKGEEVSLNGFGKFKVQNKPAREGRNPSTGATIKIAASKKVSFQPAKALKDAVNG